MITLISTPACYDPVDTSYVSRWIATESPNNFRLFRNDWTVISETNLGGYLQFVVDGVFTGGIGDNIAVYNYFTNTMHVGNVTNISGTTITTDIDWIIGMDIRYVNDNTLHGGYYFEGRLTINGVLNDLTIIASPDTFGYADLDVSGVLRIMTSLLKTGAYSVSNRIEKEPTKSGNFILEYRECWYGSNEPWEEADDDLPIVSPPIGNVWYYGECVRSEEQGSNLHEYVATDINDAPFLNLFENPVYFLGLPFDLSFIMPEQALISPSSEITVTIRNFNSANIPGTVFTELVDVDSLEGFINSLTIDPTIIDSDATYITIEITTP